MVDGRLLFLIVAAFLLGTCFGVWLPPSPVPEPPVSPFPAEWCDEHAGTMTHDVRGWIACSDPKDQPE